LFNKYYQQELKFLRKLAVEFSKTHPVAAPMLRGPTPDPDVERLLEGVAFLNGMLSEKLDDDFPELIHGLMDIVFPHYLRPIPSMSVVLFEAKPSLKESLVVPAGTSLASVPVDGTPCMFRTGFETEVHPLQFLSLSIKGKEGETGFMTMTLELSGLTLSQWKPKCLPFLLGGTVSQAQDLFALLYGYLRRIVIKPVDRGGTTCVLTPDHLVSVGFDPANPLLPFPMRSFAGYRLVQEYFTFPGKFLFMELRGWEKWQDRGEGTKFEITFDFLPSSIPYPAIEANNLALSATPVINLFEVQAEPAMLDHHTDRIKVRPGSKQAGHFQVYNVEKVVGYTQGNVKGTEYLPLELFTSSRENNAIYQVIRSRSAIDESPAVFLSFPYGSSGSELEPQTLSIQLTCTNGSLPEGLKLGDICVQTSDSPELLNFRNIIPPTPSIDPLLDKTALWKFLAHLSLNYLSIMNLENLKEMLRLYMFQEGRDRSVVAGNLRIIDGISDVSVTPVRRLVKGSFVMGQEIQVTANKNYFAGLGGLYLFGTVLNHFFGVYSAMHTFTRFTLRESATGETFRWSERMGTKPLI
jgi:type VI secretion system protein ImpG